MLTSSVEADLTRLRSMATTTTVEGHDREKVLLRKLMKARITCDNSARELETLDRLTDEWGSNEEVLETAALDIHLQCEYSCKELSTLYEIVTGLLSGINAPGWLWTEVELRQENAVAAANEIVNVIHGLVPAQANPELGLKEMKRRAQHIVAKLETLKETFAELERDVQAGLAEAQKQTAAKAPS